MTNDMPTDTEQLMNLLDAVAETICEMTDAEVMEELGEDELLNAQRPIVREIIKRALAKYRRGGST